ncbi:MAG: lantibiotic dehydratase [Candidatus Polarisedimenticolia bacterium]
MGQNPDTGPAARASGFPIVTFLPSGFFVLRTPVLPFEEFAAWGARLEAASAIGDPERLARALASDRALLRDRLRAIVDAPLTREALFVASPDLHESLAAWTRDPDGERGGRIERSLVSYFARMAGRPMPFGLFSGCSLGTIGSATDLILEGRPAYRRSTRLDMSYLFTLMETLLRDPELRSSLTYRPNSSLYRAARRVRYVEARQGGKGRSHRLVSVEDTEHLRVTLEHARDGATAQSLAGLLLERNPDVTIEEACEYVNDLIDCQILVPDLEIPVTGPEPMRGLMDAVGGSRPDVIERLRDTQEALAALDAGGLGIDPSRYEAIARRLASLPGEIDRKRLFQVDLFKPSPCATLGGEPLGEIVEGVRILHHLVAATADPAFARFKERFIARYEGAEVSLMELLDEEAGIGFLASAAPGAEASPLLDGLPIAGGHPEPGRWTARDAFLLRKLERAAGAGAREIVLTRGDLEAMQTHGPPPPLPDAFSVTATLCAESSTAIQDGRFQIWLKYAGGPTGARLMGRFCHADEEMRRHVEHHLRAEEACDPDAIFAEIVHLPEGRLGNVLCRPVLRDYEIAYLGRSGAPADRQIPVTDLMVGIEHGRVVLRSRRLGKRVEARLTNAHAYHWRSLGVYRFLCSLQNQGLSAGLAWSWGALESASFLPRVATGRLILALARWRLDRDAIRAISSVRGPARYLAMQRLRSERALPRYVEMVESDRELPVDLENPLSLDAFAEMVKERRDVVLKEMFPPPEELGAHGPEGRFVHEMVIPFVGVPDPAPAERTPAVSQSPTRVSAGVSDRRPRRFPPGSEWLYAKLYTGTASADRVLSEAVRPLVDEAIRSGAADRWFFLRYGDPDWHVRLRLQGDPRKLGSEVLPAMHESLRPLIRDGLVWRVQLDTYEREVERYGGPEGIELAERIFHVDSEAALGLLAHLEGDEGADARWRLGARGIDMLLSDLGLDLQARRTLVARLRKGYGAELRSGKSLRIQLGARFRKERGDLVRLLDPEMAADHPLWPAIDPLCERSARLAPLISELKILQATGRLAVPFDDLAASYVHLHVNRLLRSVHRPHELVLYDFLERLYESRAARLGASRPRQGDPARQT